MNTEKELRDVESARNAEIISHELNKLENSYQNKNIIDYQPFWTHTKQITELFRTLKPLNHEVREVLWGRFNGICEEVKDIQREQKEKQSKLSIEKKILIFKKLSDLTTSIESASTSSSLGSIQQSLNNILQLMKNEKNEENHVTDIILSTKLTYDDQNECWTSWKNANDLLQTRRSELISSFFRIFHEKADEIREMAQNNDPYAAKEQIRQFQIELKNAIMKPEQFQEIRSIIDESWKIASNRIEEIKKEAAQRAIGNIERWEQLIINNELIIDQLEAQIEECKVMEKDATSYEFALKVKSWIEEKTEKIERIQATIADLKQRIETGINKYGNPGD